MASMPTSDLGGGPMLSPLQTCLGWREAQLTYLAGDGSDRRYFRLADPSHPGTHYVVMQLGPDDAALLAANRYDWVHLAKDFSREGLRVPKIIASLPAEGLLVIEDFGDMTFEAQAHALLESDALGAVSDLYLDAVGLIGKFLAMPRHGELTYHQRAFDQAKLTFELRFFKEHYVDGVLACEWSAAELQAFTDEVASLTRYLSNLPRYCVHRDFHSRNLLMGTPPGAGLGVIDFQDARLGPAAYDLVSLCFDAYVPLPLEKRHEFLILGMARLGQRFGEGLLDELSVSWRPMLLQRQLKALGSFGYLTKVKQRGSYLRYAAPAIASLALCRDRRWPFLSMHLPDLYLQQAGKLLTPEAHGHA